MLPAPTEEPGGEGKPRGTPSELDLASADLVQKEKLPTTREVKVRETGAASTGTKSQPKTSLVETDDEQRADMEPSNRGSSSRPPLDMKEKANSPDGLGEVTADDLAATLLAVLKGTSTRTPRFQTWLDTMQELFERVHRKKTTGMNGISVALQRLPKLNRVEQEKLLDLFEQVVLIRESDWTVWREEVDEILTKTYRTRQTLVFGLNKRLGDMSMAAARSSEPLLTEWAQKITGQQNVTVATPATTEAFMFNPLKYNEAVIARFRGICERAYGKHRNVVFREGTDDEWEIVQGILEGNIVCRMPPQFLSRIMTTESKLQVIETIRVQVEGCLIMELSGELPIKAAFQSTKNLRETIATSIL